jgi:hypothetical protein
MTLLRTILAELVHLFVDDGAMALSVALLIAVIAVAVKLMMLQPLLGAILLFAGCITILADSLRRAVKRRS